MPRLRRDSLRLPWRRWAPGGPYVLPRPPEEVRQLAEKHGGWPWWKCVQCGTYHNAALGEELREPFNTCPPGLLGPELFITPTSTEAVLGNRRFWGFQYERGHFVEHSHQGVKWKSTPGIRTLGLLEADAAALVERFVLGDWAMSRRRTGPPTTGGKWTIPPAIGHRALRSGSTRAATSSPP